jgi:D-alanyl-D-alanine dipeptidase
MSEVERYSSSEEWLHKPIPELSGVEDRELVPIRECGELLVLLNGFAPDLVEVRPEYAVRGYRSANREAFARERVAQMLRLAAGSLPPARRLLVWDAWRPTVLQKELFSEEYERQRRLHPEFTEEELVRETKKFVSIPSADPLTPAPHLTGGAIDLTICDAAGAPVPMGTDFDHFGPEAATRYLEERLESDGGLSIEEEVALQNRRVLYWAMATVGFTNYREEWWHFDFGNQFWGKVKVQESIYGGYERAGS